MKIGERELPTEQIESLETRISFIEDLITDNEITQAIDELQELLGDTIHHPDFNVRDDWQSELRISVGEVLWHLINSQHPKQGDAFDVPKALISLRNRLRKAAVRQ